MQRGRAGKPIGFSSPLSKLGDIGEAFKSGGLLGIGKWSLQVFDANSPLWKPDTIESYPRGSARAKIALRRAWQGWSRERKSVAKPVAVDDERTIAQQNKLDALTRRVDDRIRLEFILAWLHYVRDLKEDLRTAVRIVHNRIMRLQGNTFKVWRNLKLEQASTAQDEEDSSQWEVKDSPTECPSPAITSHKVPDVPLANEEVSVTNTRRSPSPRLEIVSDTARPVSQEVTSIEISNKPEASTHQDTADSLKDQARPDASRLDTSWPTTGKDSPPIDGLCEDTIVDLGPIPEHANTIWPDLDLSTYGPQEAPWRKKRRSMMESVVGGLASFAEKFTAPAKSTVDTGHQDEGAGAQGEPVAEPVAEFESEERRAVKFTEEGQRKESPPSQNMMSESRQDERESSHWSSSPNAVVSHKRMLPAKLDGAKGRDSESEYRLRVETVMKQLGVGPNEAVKVLKSIESGQIEGALSVARSSRSRNTPTASPNAGDGARYQSQSQRSPPQDSSTQPSRSPPSAGARGQESVAIADARRVMMSSPQRDASPGTPPRQLYRSSAPPVSRPQQQSPPDRPRYPDHRSPQSYKESPERSPPEPRSQPRSAERARPDPPRPDPRPDARAARSYPDQRSPPDPRSQQQQSPPAPRSSQEAVERARSSERVGAGSGAGAGGRGEGQWQGREESARAQRAQQSPPDRARYPDGRTQSAGGRPPSSPSRREEGAQARASPKAAESGDGKREAGAPMSEEEKGARELMAGLGAVLTGLAQRFRFLHPSTLQRIAPNSPAAVRRLLAEHGGTAAAALEGVEEDIKTQIARVSARRRRAAASVRAWREEAHLRARNRPLFRSVIILADRRLLRGVVGAWGALHEETKERVEAVAGLWCKRTLGSLRRCLLEWKFSCPSQAAAAAAFRQARKDREAQLLAEERGNHSPALVAIAGMLDMARSTGETVAGKRIASAGMGAIEAAASVFLGKDTIAQIGFASPRRGRP